MMWPELPRSYAIDAMQSRPAGRMGQKQVQRFITDAALARVTDQPTVGVGRLQRLEAGNASGSALVFKNAVLHLDLFPRSRFEADDGPAPRLDLRRRRTLH